MAGGTRAGRAAGSEGVKEGRCWSPAATWGPPGSGLREWWSREVEIATRESGEAEEREREEERREREREVLDPWKVPGLVRRLAGQERCAGGRLG